MSASEARSQNTAGSLSGDRSMTKAWEYYELGRAYNNSLSPPLYSLVHTNVEFFSGNQWLHMPDSPAMSRLPRPCFNIIKRVVSLFVASLTSSPAAIGFEPLSFYDGEKLDSPDAKAAEYATAEVRNLMEKFKLDYRIREALFDGAQTGDYCAHFYWNPEALPYGGAFSAARGEIEMELVDGVNVMFGNPNIAEVERQPYILIVGRESVGNLERERLHYQRRREGQSPIRPDADCSGQPGMGGSRELPPEDERTGKALYVYLYTKVRKTVRTEAGEESVSTVHVTKATRDAYIFEDIDTGLSRYPVAWGNWERQKNSYHGRALVTGIVPNQVFINSMMAMVFRHLQLQSFPKTLYNADLIPSWSNEVGAALAVRNLQPGQSLDTVAVNLRPADMSNQIIAAIDKVFSYTKDCLGATDAQLGSVRPDNTSALMVLQSSAEVPLENTRALLYSFLEDVGAILLDMMGTYYGERPLVRERLFREPETDAAGNPAIDPVSGELRLREIKRRVLEPYDFSVLKRLWLNVSVDVGASTYYSEIAMVQTLDNLRRDGTLGVIDYLERVPDKLIPRKGELISSLRESLKLEGAAEPLAKRPSSAPAGAESPLANLPGGIQSRYSTLPASARRALTGRL